MKCLWLEQQLEGESGAENWPRVEGEMQGRMQGQMQMLLGSLSKWLWRGSQALRT